jgi:hypothetical protein
MAVQIARSTVFPGDYTYVWSYQANLLSAYSLHNDTLGNFPLVQVTLATRGLATWDVNYQTGLLLPSPIPGNLQGVFQLWNGPDQQNQAPLSPAVNIRILPPADDLTTLTTTLSPQQPVSQVDDAPRIQIALQNYRLVILAPGVYYLRTPIDFPSYYTLDAEGDATMYFRTLRGYGAILVRSWDSAAGQYVTPFFRFVQQNPTSDRDHVTFEGLTFAAERRPSGLPATATIALITNNPPADSQGLLSNFTLRRCVFRNVQLGQWSKPGFWAEDCVWEEGGGCTGMSGPALWLRCTFRGLIDPVSGNAWSGTAGSGMAVLDSDFIATDRGPVLKVTDTDVTENLFSGMVCDRLGEVFDGCEVGAQKNTTHHADYNLFLHLRYRGEGFGFRIFKVNATGNLLRDFVLDGGGGIQIVGDDAHAVYSNTVEQGEVRGGRCRLENATENYMRNVGFIGPRPTQGSEFGAWGNPDPNIGPIVTNQAVITNFAANPGIDYPPHVPAPGTIRFARLLDGWTDHD